VLVVGAGEMGRRAARALVARGAALFVASRTPERAAVLAGDVGGRAVPFDPGAEVLRDVDGVMVALTGAWPLSPGSRQALTQSAAWIVDLSAPPAIEGWLAEALGRRLTTVDMLAEPALSTVSEPLMRRLEELVEATVAEHMAWTGRGSRREVTRALAARASQAQAAELAALWRRLPGLPPEQRAEVVQMARHLAERLLRDPLEQLDRDTDGQREIAARELFRL
jgi:glutamyl-tRNA reductase